MTKTIALTPHARRYLARLRRELGDHDIDAATRSNLMTDIEDSLIGLDDAATEERIVALGSPRQIALTAAEEHDRQRPTMLLPTLGERICVALALVACVLGLLQPFLGAGLSVATVAWAIAARDTTVRRRSYRTSLWCGVAALIVNVVVLLALLSVGPAEPTGTTVVQIG